MAHAKWVGSNGEQPAREQATGFSGIASDIRQMLANLAGEIDETRERQTRALSALGEQIAAAERRSGQASVGDAGEGHWDAESAEALTKVYERQASETQAMEREHRDQAVAQRNHQEARRQWHETRFEKLAASIQQTLAGMWQSQPPAGLTLLDERLRELEREMATALEDVARRSDVEGLRMIGTHVEDLAAKLDLVQSQVALIGGLERDVRHMVDQVSEERLSRLIAQGSNFAADLEAVASRAADKARSHFAEDMHTAMRGESARYVELRSLIEASIQEWRLAEAQAGSVVHGLGGAIGAQSDRYLELKSLIEAASDERRLSNDQTLTTLDTLQDALVRILDRMDAIEDSLTKTTAAPQAPRPATEAGFDGAAAPMPRTWAAAPVLPAAPMAASRMDALHAAPHMAPQAVPGFDDHDQPPANPAAKMRRDFVAEAQRAKLKAAAQGASDTSRARKPNDIAAEDTGGLSISRAPKILAAALALIVAINGGLLIFSQWRQQQIPVIAIEPTLPTQAPNVAGDASPAGDRGGDKTVPRQGSEPQHDTAENGNKPRSDLATGDLSPVRSTSPFQYDARDDGPTIENAGPILDTAPTGWNSFSPITASIAPEPEQPAIAADVKTAPEEAAKAELAQAAPGRTAPLDLPPATVGPLSMRVAAANGDPSAEFEVASRLAEGKGTSQNFKESVRWYQRAAAQGFTQAHYRLGTLFERGLGVKKDIARARIWYQRAAEKGSVKAMHNLAVLAAGGENGSPDYTSAVKWFQDAAARGLSDSQFNLAVLYENGLGVNQDRAIAYKWYALAAKGGDKDSAQRRDELAASLTEKERKAGEEMLKAFKPMPIDALANDPRVAGNDWKKRSNDLHEEIGTDAHLLDAGDDAAVATADSVVQ
ncbi:MAG: tetratricopeptide repeat protein [Hyphomicrobium sp.]|jgi:localization factor PodJL